MADRAAPYFCGRFFILVLSPRSFVLGRLSLVVGLWLSCVVTKDYVLAVLSAIPADEVQLGISFFFPSVVRAIQPVRSEWQHLQLRLSLLH